MFSASSCPKQRRHSGAYSSFFTCHVVLLVRKGHFSKAIRIKLCGSCLSGLLRGLPRSPREPVCTRHRAEHGFPRKGVEKGSVLPTCRCSESDYGRLWDPGVEAKTRCASSFHRWLSLPLHRPDQNLSSGNSSSQTFEIWGPHWLWVVQFCPFESRGCAGLAKE